ncbi:MAG TPA: FHA domain-containing protein [Planctomycetaceae bacterium]
MSMYRDSKRRRLLVLQNQASTDVPNPLMQPPKNALAPPESQLSIPRMESGGALSTRLEPFFEACGGVHTLSMAAQRRAKRGATEIYAFRQPFVVIGRCPDCDFVIPDPSVNYRHFYLQLIAGRWFFANLARLSETKAGQGHPASGWFDVDVALKVGSITVTRVATAERGVIRRSAELPCEQMPGLPSFRLERVVQGNSLPEPTSREYVAPVTLIGASRNCDLSLDDETVSRVHASLVSTPDGIWAVDLMGRGGIQVDGRRAAWSPIEDGSILKIGRIAFRVLIDASEDRPIGRVGLRAMSGDLSTAGGDEGFRGGLSEGAVLAMTRQFADMQAQFFEHNRLQMQWMSEMLARVSETQQETARQDLARIEEIARELRELRSQLVDTPAAPPLGKGVCEWPLNQKAGSEVNSPEATVETASRTQFSALVIPDEFSTEPSGIDSRAGFQPRPASESRSQDEVGPDPQCETAPQPARHISKNETEENARPPSLSTQVDPNSSPEKRRNTSPAGVSSNDAHAWLTQRMATLSREHDGLWRRLMNTFTGGTN